MRRLFEVLEDPTFLAQLKEHQELAGYQSPTTGRITYNKVVNKTSFAVFSDIVESVIPMNMVMNPEKQERLPSMANVFHELLPASQKSVHIYPQYLYMNATLDEFMEHETEEDQDNMDRLVEVLDELDVGMPVVGLTIHKNEAMQSAHASAFIAWRSSDTKYKFAFYDPLAYYKDEKRSYDYAERSFVASRFDQAISFVNLHQYCYHKTPKEFHCSQYVMNAEYCYIFSLYFLFVWIHMGCKRKLTAFQKAIEATYVVSPEKLTRADNRESMIYRVIMMAFVCKTLRIYLKKVLKLQFYKVIRNRRANVRRIDEYLQGFRERYGFALIEDSDF